jgi:hypothetical protein
MALVRYDPASKQCATGPQPGLVALVQLWREVTALPSYGIFNCRTVRGRSTPSMHGDGRAADLGANANDARHRALADQFCAFLVWAGPHIGMQYLIWNRRQIKPGQAWRRYRGVNPHTDHIHAELNWDGARAVTIDQLRHLWAQYTRNGKAAPAAPHTPPPATGRSTSDRIRDLQIAFNAAGEKLTVDGIWGPKMERAANRQWVGYSEHVEACAYARWGRTLAVKAQVARLVRRLRNHPEVVRCVQRLLNERTGGGFSVDGVPGPQTNHGIVVVLGQSDAICGPAGFKRLVGLS